MEACCDEFRIEARDGVFMWQSVFDGGAWFVNAVDANGDPACSMMIYCPYCGKRLEIDDGRTGWHPDDFVSKRQKS